MVVSDTGSVHAVRPPDIERPESTEYPDVEDLLDLAGYRGGTRVSVFLPIGAWREAKSRIRARDLLRRAGQAMRRDGVGRSQVDDLLRAAQAVVDATRPRPRSAAGLALFLGRQRVHHFLTPVRVPELAVIGDRFTIGPLLPALMADGTFFVLGVTREDIRLLRGSRHTLQELPLDGLPLAAWQTLPPRPPQTHAFLADRGGAGNRAVFHGAGDDGKRRKAKLLQHFRGVDTALRAALADAQAPLLLAGVPGVQALYRQVNTYAPLLAEGLDVDPRAVRAEELHGRAWPLVEPVLRQTADAAVARFHGLRGTGRTVEGGGEVLPAAERGQVQTLLFSVEAGDWGAAAALGPVMRATDAPRGIDRLERAVLATARHSGQVLAVPGNSLPEGVTVAGVLRYPSAS
jgi:hypothetical protein